MIDIFCLTLTEAEEKEFMTQSLHMPRSAEMIRLLIVHCSPLFRLGLRTALQRFPQIQVVGDAGEQAVSLAQSEHPDVALVDGALPNALEMVSRLRLSGIAILVFASPLATEEELFQVMVHGAMAYEPVSIFAEDLVEKIERIACGEYLINDEIWAHSPNNVHDESVSVGLREPGSQFSGRLTFPRKPFNCERQRTVFH